MCQPVVMGFVLHRMQSDGYIEFFEIQYSPALCVRVSGLTMTTHHAWRTSTPLPQRFKPVAWQTLMTAIVTVGRGGFEQLVYP